jgi:hypothetical protein
MTPQALDELDDETWLGLVRFMQHHADAIAAEQAKLPR